MTPVTKEEIPTAQAEEPENKSMMFDSLQNNWEELLSNLCYMSDHIGEYQDRLNDMLSNVDQEICDIMHYLSLIHI